MAADHRRQRGAQPPALRPPPGRPRAAGCRDPPLGGRGPVSRGGGSGRRASPRPARRRGAHAGAGPHGDRRALLPRAVGAGDGRGARLPAGHREVACLARAGQAAARAGRGWRPRPAAAGQRDGGVSEVTELELERALADLGTHLEYPPTPPLAEAVVARLAERPSSVGTAGERPPRRVAARPLAWLAGRPGWQRLAVAALALIVLAAGIVVATPGAREAVARRLGIPGVAIHLGGPAPTTPAAPPGAGANLNLGRRVTIDQARAGVSFGLLLPSAPGFQAPDAVYLSQDVPGGRVDLVYRPRPGLPVSKLTNAGLLITEFRGDPLVEKISKEATLVERVMIRGETGYWFSGSPHSFVYLDRDGNAREETSRLAGSTLVWTHNRLTLRLEGQVSKAEALRIAGSMR